MLDPAKRLLLARLPLAELLPAITMNGRSEPLIEPRRCYLESDSSGDEHSGYPVLTSITTFSMSDPDSVQSICYDQAADGVYASQDALYISEPRFDVDKLDEHAHPQVLVERHTRRVLRLGGSPGRCVGHGGSPTFA